MGELTATVTQMNRRCEEFEAKFRANNIRLVGLPEGSEGPRPTVFVAELLRDVLGLEETPVDRVHRILRAKPKEGEPPRPMISRC